MIEPFIASPAASTLGLGSGSIRPIRINGRLAWSVDDIKRLLNMPLAAECKLNVDETGLHNQQSEEEMEKGLATVMVLTLLILVPTAGFELAT